MGKSKIQQLLDSSKENTSVKETEEVSVEQVQKEDSTENVSLGNEEQSSVQKDEGYVESEVSEDSKEEIVEEVKNAPKLQPSYQGSELQKELLKRKPSTNSLDEELKKRRGITTPITLLEQLKQRKKL